MFERWGEIYIFFLFLNNDLIVPRERKLTCRLFWRPHASSSSCVDSILTTIVRGGQLGTRKRLFTKDKRSDDLTRNNKGPRSRRFNGRWFSAILTPGIIAWIAIFESAPNVRSRQINPLAVFAYNQRPVTRTLPSPSAHPPPCLVFRQRVEVNAEYLGFASLAV